jgi:hypothetical protein
LTANRNRIAPKEHKEQKDWALATTVGARQFGDELSTVCFGYLVAGVPLVEDAVDVFAKCGEFAPFLGREVFSRSCAGDEPRSSFF